MDSNTMQALLADLGFLNKYHVEGRASVANLFPARLLNTARSTRYFAPILLAVTMGLRRGEALALAWSSVDLEAERLIVCRSLEQTEGDKLAFKEPKTASSRRLLPIPDFVVEELKKYQKLQDSQKKELEQVYQDHDLVCPLEDGRPYPPDNFSRDFKDIARKAKLGHIRYHDLRHTMATLLFSQGVHPKIVSMLLGHASVKITLDKYSHIIPGLGEGAAKTMDGLLRKKTKKKGSSESTGESAAS